MKECSHGMVEVDGVDLHHGRPCGMCPRARADETGPGPGPDRVQLPLLTGWFEGEAVLKVTTDVSHADVAAAKGANFAPRLAQALPSGPPQPGRRSSVDKVYAVTNFEQASVFASAPSPVGRAAATGSTAPCGRWSRSSGSPA